MILRSVTLDNFGLYAGSTTLDLVPRVRPGGASPIVLIGGKNGTGKTTLLEAVRLALYGKRALGVRVGQAEYDAHLRQRIHRSRQATGAAVGLEFDYAEAGRVHRYSVRREWAIRGKAVVESLLLEKDGAPIATVPREEWHLFLQELIPPGVSQLFFFDGEKISDIAEGEDDNEHLAEAMRGLLGIELVGRLRADLSLYLARHLRNEDDSIATRMEAITRDIAISETRTEELSGQTADLSSLRESQARSAEQIRRQFVAEGGEAALNRARVEAQRDEARREIGRIEHEIRDLANQLLPFAYAPKLVALFKVALESSTKSEGGASRIGLKSLVARWRQDSLPGARATWSETHWSDLDRALREADDTTPAPTTHAALKEVGDGAAALKRLAEVEQDVRPRAAALCDELEHVLEQSRALDIALSRADAAASGVLLDELRLADQRVGATDAHFRSRSEELKLARGQLVTLNRERRRLEEEQAASAAAAERAGLAARTVQALADYENRLLEQKIRQLRAQFVACFNQLARKSDLVVDISIDSETFAASLIDGRGRVIPKSALSAGEKQIYAITMLWALARTSGRPLPMIIDTPLARLDSEHRERLTTNYFPIASHQVILLSTDTELGEELTGRLGASVSHAYRLDYDRDEQRTLVSSGYFDTSREERHELQQA